jgi:hypothetical protein
LLLAPARNGVADAANRKTRQPASTEIKVREVRIA